MKHLQRLSLEVFSSTYTEPKLLGVYNTTLCHLLRNGLRCETSKIISWPAKKRKWSILSSPFVHKVAFTQFERRCHRESFKCYNLNPQLYPKVVWYIQKNAPMDVRMHFRLHYHEKLPYNPKN